MTCYNNFTLKAKYGHCRWGRRRQWQQYRRHFLGHIFSWIHLIFKSKAPQHILFLFLSIEKWKNALLLSGIFLFIKKQLLKKCDFRSLQQKKFKTQKADYFIKLKPCKFKFCIQSRKLSCLKKLTKRTCVPLLFSKLNIIFFSFG